MKNTDQFKQAKRFYVCIFNPELNPVPWNIVYSIEILSFFLFLSKRLKQGPEDYSPQTAGHDCQ